MIEAATQAGVRFRVDEGRTSAQVVRRQLLHDATDGLVSLQSPGGYEEPPAAMVGFESCPEPDGIGSKSGPIPGGRDKVGVGRKGEAVGRRGRGTPLFH